MRWTAGLGSARWAGPPWPRKRCCHFGNAALACGLVLSRWSWLALGLLKEVGGDMGEFI